MLDQNNIDVLLSARWKSGGSDAIKDILKAAAAPGVLSMAGGLPAPDSFPAEAIAEATAAALGSGDPAALQYAPTEGVAAMREAVATLATRTGAPVDVACVMVTSGSQQGLDLVARLFVEDGDTVALEDPSYLGAVQTFRQSGARLLAIPGDRDGMDVEVLASQLAGGERCKVVYVVPHFHNPTGAVLPPDRRRLLAQLAERYGFIIVEDDPYADLAFNGQRLPSVDIHTDRVVRLMSLSKSICPGLRVAGLTAPASMITKLASVKQCADLQTNTFGQHVLARVLGVPDFVSNHLSRLQTLYRTRAEDLVELLSRELPVLRFEPPRGGLFFWCVVDDPAFESDKLARAALSEGVAVVPGGPFCVRRDGSRYLRLSYATLNHSEMEEAVRRLGVAIDRSR